MRRHNRPSPRDQVSPASSAAALRVDQVSKHYRIGEHHRRNQLFTERIAAALRWPQARAQGQSGRPQAREDSLKALDDVSFELEHGDALGIIGRNGAGKSTLLKVISRITPPSEGRVILHGRVATLLEVGTGFHPELTGRENVYLNGAVLGMRRHEIERRFDEIVSFSGVERFLDTPVKRYSSGMYVRLAFAVAAHLEPEILLVDEVLSVGDQEFQRKCLGKMRDVAGEGRTVVFVSHNLNAVQRLCNRALLIDGGRLAHQGDPADVIATYLDRVEPDQAGGFATLFDDEGRPGGGEARLRRVAMTDSEGTGTNSVRFGQSFELELTFEVFESLESAVEVGFSSLDGSRVATAYSVDWNGPPLHLEPGTAAVRVRLEDLSFVPGEYVLSVYLRHMSTPPIDYVDRALRFIALNTDASDSDHYRWPVQPSVRPRSAWTVQTPAAQDRVAESP